ncbi:MAG: phage head-tail connector protein [Pseudomonadota bacterium]
MTLSIIDQPAMIDAAALDELKALLAIENSEDDALLLSHLRSAHALCEAFTGRALLHSRRRYRLALRTGMQRLPDHPVIAIEEIRAINADGTGMALPITAYQMDIDAEGFGSVALMAPLPAQSVEVRYIAGIAAQWEQLPELLRQGIVRLAAHQHLQGAADSEVMPPIAVAALWRPWRRLRLA